MSNHGFIRVAAASPIMKVADSEFNIREIIKLINKANSNYASIVVFPELGITGYTCGDLFGQRLLLDKATECLGELLYKTRNTDVVSLVGMPVMIDQKLFNCGVVIHHGVILGVVPKIHLANYKEFYEQRWFTSGHIVCKKVNEINILGKSVPFGNLVFKSENPRYTLGVEICEDLWSVIPPSSFLAINGATVIANLSASNELVSKADYRRQLVIQQSARCLAGYVYSSAGVNESTTDTVFGGDCMIAENGIILQSVERFQRDSTLIFTDLDIHRLETERQVNKSFADSYDYNLDKAYQNVQILHGEPQKNLLKKFKRKIEPHPFIPGNPNTRDDRCQEIFNIQVTGLAKRLEHTAANCAVIGVSGGLDSTLALLVIAKTFDLLKISSECIIGVTMPGFGTTDMTYHNAVKLMKSLGVKIKDIDIRPACMQHFTDIDQDPVKHDITYENSQARERTQILMDIANKENGLVIGTGDLSEIALGWSTYNGDHMSMYAVNCSVPKTLVRFLVNWIADNVFNETTKDILYRILATPISPELLPPDSAGKIKQKTEEVIGPYELHDFFLYYAIRFGMPPQKVLFLAEVAFKKKYTQNEIKKWLQTFYKRFFSQQFKRSCIPDGPKVGTISLSPRGDWRMPSDAEVSAWIKELD
jgi:NAD+ synthase (glutamine-hydrolysing)